MMIQIQERDAELCGIAIGEKRGQERGIAIGEKRGILNTRIEITKEMLVNGLAVEMVAKLSGLPIEQVLAIKAQLASN